MVLESSDMELESSAIVFQLISGGWLVRSGGVDLEIYVGYGGGRITEEDKVRSEEGGRHDVVSPVLNERY